MSRYIKEICITEGCTRLGENKGLYNNKKIYDKYCYKCKTLKYPKRKLTKLYISYKQAAIKRNIKFELTKEEFKKILEKDCNYCFGKGFGIDRRNNDNGYTKENCVSCCKLCNQMKSNRTRKEFIEHCIRIANVNREC